MALPFVNGATGPIEVKGAKPGDMLRLDILDMRLNGLGFTVLWPGIGIFPDWVRQAEFGHQATGGGGQRRSGSLDWTRSSCRCAR